MPEFRYPLAIACHDAGAANIAMAWLDERRLSDCRAVMAGPARQLWTDRFGTQLLVESIEEGLAGTAMLLSGTGWASDFEHRARQMAAEAGVFSVAVLDHWVNYADRFVRDGVTVWPDEFWVADEYALHEAGRVFPGQTIRPHSNEYLKEMVSQIPLAAAAPQLELLYVLEPIRIDWGRGRPGEFQALDYLLARLEPLEPARKLTIRLRLHPSEPLGKYDEWIAAQGRPNIRLDYSENIAQAMAGAKWVAGCESFALTMALEAGRSVICTLPPWASACRLPHRGLIHLKDILDHEILQALLTT